MSDGNECITKAGCDYPYTEKDRYIGKSVRLTDDLLKYAEDENIDGILFAADIEKAFDSVDHNFMFAALKRFGFGNDFVQWIKTIFKSCQSCVMNNAHLLGILIWKGKQDKAILYLHVRSSLLPERLYLLKSGVIHP